MAANAFDDSVTTKWLDFSTNYPNTRQSWIQYQYPNNQRQTVTRYSITSANDSVTYPDRNPSDWHFLGSNNGGQSWTTLDTRTNQAFTTNYQTLSYNFTNNSSYNVYRFQIDRVYNPQVAVAMQLAELEFLFVPTAYSYFWSFGDGVTSTVQNPQRTYLNNGVYNVTLVVSDGLTTATNSTTITVAQPMLSISNVTPGQVTITWPAWARNSSLYSSTNLATPISWTPVTNAATLTGNNYVVTLPIDVVGNRFLALIASP